MAYTRNVIISFLSIFCVSFIMICIICLMVLNEWEMGISESISLVLLIGLSVDYLVHLAAHFINSKKQTNLGRLKEAYGEIAIGITSGAITTFGCGLFLFGGKNLVFKKFATLISSTIAFSFLTSMLLFGALSAQFFRQHKK